jgi:CBS domain-containing protein
MATASRDAETSLSTDHMSDMGPGQVRLYVSDGLIQVGPETTVRRMAQRLAAEGVGALVVVEGDQVHGIVSERDLMLAIAAGHDLDATTAADLDSRDLVTCTPDTTVHDAAVLMMEYYVRHLLVRDHTGPVGMISARDLLGAYAS